MNDSSRNTVRILDEDRTFGSALSPDDLSAGRRSAVANVHELGRGRYATSELSDNSGLLGLLVLDGLVVRQFEMAGRRCGEIIGPGALLRPWDDYGTAAPLPFELDWRVLQPVRFALLDRRFLAAIVRWPALIEAFLERATERTHALAFNAAIHSVQRVDIRLLLLFWKNADTSIAMLSDKVRAILDTDAEVCAAAGSNTRGASSSTCSRSCSSSPAALT